MLVSFSRGVEILFSEPLSRLKILKLDLLKSAPTSDRSSSVSPFLTEDVAALSHVLRCLFSGYVRFESILKPYFFRGVLF